MQSAHETILGSIVIRLMMYTRRLAVVDIKLR
jgi:hypothetical protein